MFYIPTSPRAPTSAVQGISLKFGQLVRICRNALKVATFRLSNLSKGKTLQSKIRYKMAWDRDPKLRVMTDKFLVRDYVRDTVGENYLVPLLWVGSTVDDIPWTGLPRQFVARVTHGSGGVFLITERAKNNTDVYKKAAGRWSRFELHPEAVVPTELGKVLESWLRLKYEFRKRKPPAWAYGSIEPRILIEKLIGQGAEELSEIKSFCINGEVRFVKHLVGNLSVGKKGCYYAADWKHIELSMSENGIISESMPPSKEPPWFREAVRVSQELSSGFDFVRVDLLEDNGRIYFGELTFYPQGGNFEFDPATFSKSCAEDWDQRFWYLRR